MLLSFSDSLSGLFFALLGVYLFFASSATKLHFFLGVFLHFITGDDSDTDKEVTVWKFRGSTENSARRLPHVVVVEKLGDIAASVEQSAQSGRQNEQQL